MKLLRALGGLLAVAVVVAAIGVLALRAGWGDSDRAVLQLRYLQPPARMITIDGVPLRVVDEGSGPVVVMLHGSIVSLHEWDLVAQRLRKDYRVVRLDWPPYGMSGPDPSGVYSTPRAAQLLAGLVEALQLPPFVLVATSNGANVALEYNQHHADKLRALALSIVPLERPSQTRAVDWRIRMLQPVHRYLLPEHHFRWWYRVLLEDTTAPGFQPSDAMVDTLYDMNNLPGAARRQAQYIDANTKVFKSGDAIAAAAADVRVPVLLQWCELDTVISQGAQSTVKRFTHAPVELINYPDIGHFPMWEQPDRFTDDLRRFLLRVNAQAERASPAGPAAQSEPAVAAAPAPGTAQSR